MAEPRFLVVRLGSLGDIVHAFPAVGGLREAFPASEIVWLTHPKWETLVRASCLANEVWTVDTRDWTGSSAATIVRRVAHGDAITPAVRAGGVIILHMNGEHTGRALPGVIHAVRARGLHLHALPR